MISTFRPARAVGREGMRLLSENRVAEPWVPLARQLLLNIGSGALARAPGSKGYGCSIPLLVAFVRNNPKEIGSAAT